MSDDKSMVAYQEGKDAQQKFDAFLVGICGALFAYIAQTYVPRKLALDPSIFDPLALVLLAISFFAGLKRMEAMMQASRFNFHILDSGKNIGSLMEIQAKGVTDGFFKSSGEILSVSEIPKVLDAYEKKRREARTLFEKSATTAQRCYRIRNLFLLLGFASIFLSKLLSPYFAATTTPKSIPQPILPTQTDQKPASDPTPPKK